MKDLPKTQVEYCWFRPKLAFWCYFSFPSTWSIVYVSKTFRFNAHCVDAWISRDDKYHNRRKAMDLMVWKKKKKKKRLEDRVTEGMEREKKFQRKKEK